MIFIPTDTMANNNFIKSCVVFYAYTICIYLFFLGISEAIGLYNIETIKGEECKNGALRVMFITNFIMNILSSISLAIIFYKYNSTGDFSVVTEKRSITIVVAMVIKLYLVIEYFTNGSCDINNKQSNNFIKSILLTEFITFIVLITTVIFPSVYFAHSKRKREIELLMSQDELHEGLLNGDL